MAEKLTDRTLKSGSFADDDLFHVVDVSNTSQDPAGSSFKVKLINLWNFLKTKLSLQEAYNGGNTINSATLEIDSTKNLIALTISSDLTSVGDYNVGVGYETLKESTQQHITAIGASAGRKNAGKYNFFGGFRAGYNPVNDTGQSGDYVVGIGVDAARNNTGDYVIFLGAGAGQENTNTKVVGISQYAARGNTGTRVNALGYRSAYLSSGNDVNALGENAANQSIGNAINALGNSACSSQTGSGVNAMGDEAGKFNAGSNCNLFGYDAGHDNLGNNLNAFGDQAGRENEGDNCTFIGSNAGFNVSESAGNRGNKIDGMFGIANADLPSYTNRAVAVAAITVLLGAPSGTTYCYYNQSTFAIEGVRL